MDRIEHGRARAGKVGASVAHIIDKGGAGAWKTLAAKIWADETSEGFAAPVGGARQYGHNHETEGAAKFWERHPEVELQDDVGSVPYSGSDARLKGFVAASPDRLVVIGGKVVCGLEVKSPTKPDNFHYHTPERHAPQCGHSMLVTGLPWWWLVVHHGNEYVEYRLNRNMVWEAQYTAKLYAFLTFLNRGHYGRRKLSLTDLDIH